jgi:integrase
MPVYYDKKRGRYRYEFDRVIAGQRQRATKLLPAPWTRDEAEAYGHEQDARLYALATGALKQEPLISEAVLVYLQERVPHLKSGDIIIRELAHVAKAIQGKRMNELPDVASAYASEQANLLEPATIRNRLAYVRAACRWAWRHKNMGTNDPGSRVVMPSVKNERHTYITEAEVKAIVRHITHPEAKAVCIVAFYSGMRLSEILRAVPTAKGWLLEDSKNGERRIVPIHATTRKLTKLWPVSVAARTVQGHWDEAKNVAGFGHVHFHDLRHSTASAMVNAGAKLHDVAGVLGHKSLASTKRYSHLSTDRLADVVNLIGAKKKA